MREEVGGNRYPHKAPTARNGGQADAHLTILLGFIKISSAFGFEENIREY